MGLFDDISGLLGAKDDEALKAQQTSSAEAARIQKEMYDQSRADLAPYREAGVKALGGMQDADYMRDFTMSDFTADPGYQFRMAEGQKALERSAAAKGGLMGGSALKGIARYSQDFASNEYSNVYNRFNADRDRRFGRLSTLSGLGSAANSQGVEANQMYGQGASEIATGMGNAQASMLLAQGNRNVGMATDAVKGGVGILACDRRLKTEIKEISQEEMAELKSCIKAYRFKYIDADKYGKGEFIGPLAQDLEKSKLGKTLIVEDENGVKQIDVGRAMMLFLATMAEAA